jgi:DNA-binding NtrC family response regulator
MLGEFLDGLGHQTTAVSDGLAAVHAVTADPPDLILLDVGMPGLNGLEALQWFQRVAPRVKIIMVSGAQSAETAARARVDGAFDYVVKPVDFAQLARSIERALQLRQLEV